jgi:hypothetical protein
MTRGHDISHGPRPDAASSTAHLSSSAPSGLDIARGPRSSPARVPSSPRGQASVELVALLPLIAVIALAVVTVLASHVAEEQAGEAAEAGALAVLQGGMEPKEAAEQSLSEAARKRATITVTDGRVHVRVRPRIVLPIPGLAERLAGEARAAARP